MDTMSGGVMSIVVFIKEELKRTIVGQCAGCCWMVVKVEAEPVVKFWSCAKNKEDQFGGPCGGAWTCRRPDCHPALVH